MPLRDHFHSPWKEDNPWEGFHSAWINTIVRHLNGALLSPQYRAVPQVHLGAFVEADLATFEREAGWGQGMEEASSGNGPATAVWSPPQPVQTLEIDLPNQDVYEVRIYDDSGTTRLVAVIEMVSPRNKDRPEARRAFVSKCAAYLQEQIGVLVVDIITNRHANLHQELLELLLRPPNGKEFPPLYAVAYHSRQQNGKWMLDTWPMALKVGQTLPTVPLWLAANLALPIDLETSYQETCQVLRIR